MASYHGPTPVTPQDKTMAKQHLNSTKSLLLKKITDHQQAQKKAKRVGNIPSAKYNKSHLVSHQKDLQEVNTSLKTLKTVNPGLAAFVGRNKVIGAKQ